jgi:hypothetical protein
VQAVVVARYWSELLVPDVQGRLTGASRIETVLRAHVRNDRKILAAGARTGRFGSALTAGKPQEL